VDPGEKELCGWIEFDPLEHEWCNNIHVRELNLLELIADAARD
jgi:hypothetical protein